LVARESMAPPRRVRKMRTMAPAVKKRERSAKIGPEKWVRKGWEGLDLVNLSYEQP
jgi:hypothetical protein